MLCTQCGGQIKDTANFCKYCGSKVIAETKDVPKEIHPIESANDKPPFEKTEPSLFEQAILTNDQFGQPDPEPSLDQDLVDPYLAEPKDDFDPITDDIIDILYSRERDEDIKTELKEILEEVGKIEQRLSIGLVSEAETKSIIEEKQELISALRSERKSLRKEKIRIEILNTEIAELKDKLEKLHIMYNEGKISNESVYNKLKNEYSEAYNEKKELFKRECANLGNWLTVLSMDVHKMKEEIDMLSTKAGIGDIEQDEAQNKIRMLEIDIYRKELAYHELKAIEEKLL